MKSPGHKLHDRLPPVAAAAAVAVAVALALLKLQLSATGFASHFLNQIVHNLQLLFPVLEVQFDPIKARHSK